MRVAIPDRTVVRTLIVLAVTQLIGWGSVGQLTVIGSQVAADLHMSAAAVFAGNSILYVTMGVCAPPLGKLFVRFGARRVMIAGTTLAVPGFALLANADGPVRYFAAWVILGMAGSATLTTAAYIMLNEIAGDAAKSAIGALMLVTGLSSSIFWPTTACLSGLVGWRMGCLVYAGSLILVSLPLNAFGLPRRPRSPQGQPPDQRADDGDVRARGTFYLIVSAIALNAFVTIGFSAVMIELLKAMGLSPAEAIGFGSLLGVLQVSARGLDFLGGGRWDGIATGLVAGTALPLAMLLLMAGRGAHWSIAGFIIVYGLGSGALAVARATIPLAFYDKDAYARAASHIALPLNVIAAASPPLMAGMLAHFGGKSVLCLAMFCSCSALLVLLRLGRRRPVKAAIGA